MFAACCFVIDKEKDMKTKGRRYFRNYIKITKDKEQFISSYIVSKYYWSILTRQLYFCCYTRTI